MFRIKFKNHSNYLFRVRYYENRIAKKTYKGKILNALDRLGYEQEKVAEKFYEMFNEENSKVY